MLSRLPKPVELSHEWVLKNFRYQEPQFYARLFDNSEKLPFELPPGHTKNDYNRYAPGAHKLYFLRGECCLCVFFSSSFYFVGDKNSADCFKDDIKSSLKANGRFKFSPNVSVNHVIEKGKPQFKILYKVFEEEYGYDSLLDIFTFIELIQLKYFLLGSNIVLHLLVSLFFIVILILHFLSLVMIWTNVALIITEQRKLIATRYYLNPLGFYQQRKIQVSFRSKNT